MSTEILNPTGIFDDPKYAKLAVENTDKYVNADPFPHIVFDNFIDPKFIKVLAEQAPKPDDISWVVTDNAGSRRIYQHDETKFKPLLREMLREMNSRQFLLFLETLTGIDNLIPDPYYNGGGLHSSGKGDYLKVHADFNWHHKLHAHRRINALLYLNEGWQDEWEGKLEFWNLEMTHAVKAYAPIANRLIVFNTTQDSNHGVPIPLACPEGMRRIQLNLYYYTTKREEDLADPHFTKYKTVNSPFAMSLQENYKASATGDEAAK